MVDVLLLLLVGGGGGHCLTRGGEVVVVAMVVVVVGGGWVVVNVRRVASGRWWSCGCRGQGGGVGCRSTRRGRAHHGLPMGFLYL